MTVINKSGKIGNLISKLNFYKLIPYPMDNCFTSRRDRSRQAPEKDVLYILPPGPVMGVCIRQVSPLTFFLSRHCDVIASFSLSSPMKTPSKLIAGLDGWALPAHWIGHHWPQMKKL